MQVYQPAHARVATFGCSESALRQSARGQRSSGALATEQQSRIAQTWSAEQYGKHDFVAALGQDLISVLSAQRSERILDLGCGDGALTTQLLASGAEVVGLDASAELLAVAQQRGISTVQLDAHDLAAASHELGHFHAVLSNAALHWMRDLQQVLQGMHAVLLPGGRIVAEMGGQGNVASIMPPLRQALSPLGLDADSFNPWIFPSDVQVKAMLEDCGFEVLSAKLFARPTPLPAGIRGWLQTFGNPFLDGIALPGDRAAALDSAVAEWEKEPANQSRRQKSGSRLWMLDYVRLRVLAVKAD